jgi:hypothetical protein
VARDAVTNAVLLLVVAVALILAVVAIVLGDRW